MCENLLDWVECGATLGRRAQVLAFLPLCSAAEAAKQFFVRRRISGKP
jgi:hypothetical protein